MARIEDLGRGDLVKIDCAACHPEFLLRLGLSPQVKVLDLKERVRCRGCGAKGRAVISASADARASELARSMVIVILAATEFDRNEPASVIGGPRRVSRRIGCVWPNSDDSPYAPIQPVGQLSGSVTQQL